MNKMNKMVTVVIPTYNRDSLLRRAIESVTSQNLDFVEIRVYDNCSSDGTEQFMQEMIVAYPCIKYTRRRENIGGLRNYKEAIDEVETPFFIPLADDDFLLPNSITTLFDAMLQDDSLAVVVSQTIHQTSNGEIANILPSEKWDFRRYEPEELVPLWLQRGHFEWSSLLFRTSAVKEVGGFDLATGLASDVDIQLQLFMRYPVRLIRHRSAVFSLHVGQLHTQIDPSRPLGAFRMISKAYEYLENYPELSAHIKSSLDVFSRHWCDMMASETARLTGIGNFLKISKNLEYNLPYASLRSYFRYRFMYHIAMKPVLTLKKFIRRFYRFCLRSR